MPDKDVIRTEAYPIDTVLDDTDTLLVSDSNGEERRMTGATLKALMLSTSEVVDDTTPQLGGDLDLNGHNIDFPTTANVSDCLDDDTMATASATTLSTSESIKAYADTKMADLVDDTTPQLGGDLDLNGHAIDFPTTANVTDCLDDDTMATASATTVATSESIKAYTDNTVANYCDIATYDATGVGGDAFDMDNMVDGTYAKITAIAVGYIDQDVTAGASPAFTSAALTTPVFTTSVSGTAFLDDDTFATATANTLASTESIKAYVDNTIGEFYQVATGTLSNAEILSLNATPIQLIASPGANKAIVVDEVQLLHDYDTAGFTAGAGEDFTIQYSGGTDIMVIDNDAINFLGAGADLQWMGKNFAIYDVSVAGTGDGVDVSGFDDEAVYATIASGEVTGGGGEIKWRIVYHVIDYLT